MKTSTHASVHGLILTTAVGVVFAAPPAHAESSLLTPHRCNIGASERFLSIEMTGETETSCSVIYEKRSEGEGPRAIWKSRNDMTFCADKLVVTMDKLRAGGWNCVAMDESSATIAQRPSTPAASEVDQALPPKRAETPAPSTAAQAPAVPVQPQAAKAPFVPQSPPAPQAAADGSRPAVPTALPPPRKGPPASGPLPLKESGDAPASTPQTLAMVKPRSEYDDWIFRWDDENKEIVFTVYSTTDGTKVSTRRWAHESLSRKTVRPSNMVLAQDAYAKQVLIVVWPEDRVQHITVLDPLIQAKPICEITTRSDRDTGWGYGVKDKALFLKGLQARNGDPGDLVEFRQVCDYTR